MRWTSALLTAAVFILVAALTGRGSTAPAPSHPKAVAAVTSPAPAAQPSSADGSPSAPAPPSTTHAYTVSDIEQSLPGTEAKDGSGMTKVVCHKSTVMANPGDTYTVSSDVTYSDGEVWSGYATLLAASEQISWEPEQELAVAATPLRCPECQRLQP